MVDDSQRGYRLGSDQDALSQKSPAGAVRQASMRLYTRGHAQSDMAMAAGERSSPTPGMMRPGASVVQSSQTYTMMGRSGMTENLKHA